MTFKSKLLALAATAIIVIVSAGCGQNEAIKTDSPDGKSAGDLKAATTEEVTLSFYTPAYVTDEEYQSMFFDPIQKKYPNIHLNRVIGDADHSLDKLISAGQIPDVMVYSAAFLQDLTDLQLAYPLEPLIKSNNLDLNQFDPATLDMVKVYSGTGKLVALPYTLGFKALYYNRDLFDKFGVPYPKSKMSWEEAVQLAKTMTRSDGGVQYYGFGIGGAPFIPMLNEIGAVYVDAKTNKAAVNTDQWRQIFELTSQFYRIPGNEEMLKNAQNHFQKDKTLAMLVANNTLRNLTGFNWDVTSLPTLKNDPGNGGSAIGVTMAISAQSKHKDAGFLTILNTLSEEVQLQMVKDGRPSPFKSSKYLTEFGKTMSNVKEQHLQQIFDVKFKAPQPLTKYDADAQKIMNQAFTDAATNAKDTNTALREGEESINAYIQGDLTK